MRPYVVGHSVILDVMYIDSLFYSGIIRGKGKSSDFKILQYLRCFSEVVILNFRNMTKLLEVFGSLVFYKSS